MSLNRTPDAALQALQQRKKALVATYQSFVNSKDQLVKKQLEQAAAHAAVLKQEQTQVEELQQAYQHKLSQRTEIETAIQQYIKELENRIKARLAGQTLCEIDDEITDENFQKQLNQSAAEINIIKTQLDEAILKTKTHSVHQEYAVQCKKVEEDIARLDEKLNQTVKEMKVLTNEILTFKNQRDLLREKNLRELLGKRAREADVQKSNEDIVTPEKKSKIVLEQETKAVAMEVVVNPDTVNSIEWQQELAVLHKICQRGTLVEFQARINSAKQTFAATFPEFLLTKPSLITSTCHRINLPVLTELINVALQLWGSKEHELFKQFIDATNAEDTSALYQMVQQGRYLMNTNQAGVEKCREIAELLVQHNADPDQAYLRKNSPSSTPISPRQNALPSWKHFFAKTLVVDSATSHSSQVKVCP